MGQRFVSITFPHLSTDWFSQRHPQLKQAPFVLKTSSHGKMIISATNAVATSKGIYPGMALTDARAILPTLQAVDDQPSLAGKLLRQLAIACIRFSPVAAVDPPQSLLLDSSGCAHLWGGDEAYLTTIKEKLNTVGYEVRMAMADTIGSAWAVAHFSRQFITVVNPGDHHQVIQTLPPEALRLEEIVLERMHKLGIHRIGQILNMPRTALRRRFGLHLMMRISQALGQEEEVIEPIQPPPAYREQLPCLEPISTAKGIRIALERLLETLCQRLKQEEKGLRLAIFKGYRLDGKVEQVEVATNQPSHHVAHLLKLFEIKIPTIEPDLGIELFLLEAPRVEDYVPAQDQLWKKTGGLEDLRLSELIDRLASRIGPKAIHRYLPDEHYWPERSFKKATSLNENLTPEWPVNQRPIRLLPVPQPIEVTAPIPDYPPMLFRYKSTLHKIVKADGPERIEQEWWLQGGQHRDYYRVEDETGHRYWLFRLGHYDDPQFQWFIHGFFA